jgi:N-carbamoylputrescine amidase
VRRTSGPAARIYAQRICCNRKIWNYAAFFSGPSVAWLLSTAKRHRIYLGFTFVESDGLDFYNTFVLSSPDGALLGQVLKNPPCSAEAYYFRAGSDEHFIDAGLGRIGIVL